MPSSWECRLPGSAGFPGARASSPRWAAGLPLSTRFRTTLRGGTTGFPGARVPVRRASPVRERVRGLEARAPMEQQPSEVTLPQAIRAGPRREFQSPIRGRGLRRATSVQTPIAVRAKLPAGRHAPLRGRPLCPRQTLYTILRPHAASCCSLRVRAPAPPGWKLPGGWRSQEAGGRGKPARATRGRVVDVRPKPACDAFPRAGRRRAARTLQDRNDRERER